MIVITLETTLISYFLISYNSNMADARTCEVKATVTTVNLQSYNDV